MFDWISSPDAWIALGTLTALEIVLGIDNIIFISILVGRLPEADRPRARFFGLALAMLSRIGLLSALAWLMRLTQPLFAVLGQEISGRDIILLVGGLFLIAKSVMEVHNSLEGGHEFEHENKKRASFFSILIQISLIDIVFSLDSVITAVGLADDVAVMITAVVISVMVMMFAARTIGDFVDKHPTIKMLALSFLIMVGLALIGEGLDLHIPKGYIYFAMAFSIVVEMINIRLRKKIAPVQLRKEIDRE
jgi:predicted tellurium resistance membrane protein TerC